MALGNRNDVCKTLDKIMYIDQSKSVTISCTEYVKPTFARSAKSIRQNVQQNKNRQQPMVINWCIIDLPPASLITHELAATDAIRIPITAWCQQDTRESSNRPSVASLSCWLSPFLFPNGVTLAQWRWLPDARTTRIHYSGDSALQLLCRR